MRRLASPLQETRGQPLAFYARVVEWYSEVSWSHWSHIHLETVTMLKTHNCGELRMSDAGKTVSLAGWVHKRRDHGGLIFIDLRDRSGLVQVTADPSVGDAYAVADRARGEYVVRIVGLVRPRPEGTANPNLPSGEIEVLARTMEILNPSKAVPIQLDDEGYRTDESLRLKYRYLDLRRARMQKRHWGWTK